MNIPRSADEITPSWLSAVLGVEVRDVATTVIGSDHGFASIIARVRPRYAPGASGPPSVVVKLPLPPGDDALFERWRAVNRSEAGFYREIGADAAVRVPLCLLALFDEETGSSALVLEDLADARFGDADAGCTVDETVLVLAELAGFHSRWWASPRLEMFEWLMPPRGLREHLAVFAERRSVFFDRYGELVPDDVAALTHRIGEGLMGRLGRLHDGPQTMIKVDCHPDNVAFATADGGERAVLFDWQGVSRGLAAVDVALFLATALKGPDQAMHGQLVEHYHEKLAIETYPLEQLLEDVRIAVLRWWIGVVAGYGAPHAAAWTGRRADLARRSIEEWAQVIRDQRLAELV